MTVMNRGRVRSCTHLSRWPWVRQRKFEHRYPSLSINTAKLYSHCDINQLSSVSANSCPLSVYCLVVHRYAVGNRMEARKCVRLFLWISSVVALVTATSKGCSKSETIYVQVIVSQESDFDFSGYTYQLSTLPWIASIVTAVFYLIIISSTQKSSTRRYSCNFEIIAF